MKLWKKITLGIVSVILLAVISLTVWQWDNINALYLYAKTSGEEIQQLTNDTAKKKEELLEKYEGIPVTDLTPEQEKAVMNGEMTIEDAVGEIEKSAASINTPTTSVNTASKAPTISRETEIVNSYLKQIYAIKAEFLAKLSKIKDDAETEFYKYPMEERTLAKKTEVITDKIIDCYELENACDIKIEALLKEMKAELNKIGGDTSVIAEIRNAYKEEKKVKKAYYIQLASENY